MLKLFHGKFNSEQVIYFVLITERVAVNEYKRQKLFTALVSVWIFYQKLTKD